MGWERKRSPVLKPAAGQRKLAKLLQTASRAEVLSTAEVLIGAVGRSFSEYGKGRTPDLMLNEIELGLASLQQCLDVLRGREPEIDTIQPALPGPDVLREARAAQGISQPV